MLTVSFSVLLDRFWLISILLSFLSGTAILYTIMRFDETSRFAAAAQIFLTGKNSKLFIILKLDCFLAV